MANNTDKLKKLLEALESDTPSREEIAQIFNTLIKNFKETVRAMEQRISTGEKDLLGKKEEVLARGKEIMEKWQYLSDFENKSKNVELSFSKMSKKMEEKMSKIQTLSNTLKSINASDLSFEAANLTEKRIRPFIQRVWDIEVNVKNNILKREEDELFIKKLEKEVKQLKKEISAKSSGGVRRVFQPYRDNFTSQTNGTTKTFYLSREPLKTATIMVFGTDFPIILDPDVDFTVSGKTLTLTDAVPAPSSGSSLVVIYHA